MRRKLEGTAFSLVAGRGDEAFVPDRCEPTLMVTPRGSDRWSVASGHLNGVEHPETRALIARSLRTLP